MILKNCYYHFYFVTYILKFENEVMSKQMYFQPDEMRLWPVLCFPADIICYYLIPNFKRMTF